MNGSIAAVVLAVGLAGIAWGLVLFAQWWDKNR